jgi:hypothetical protein
MRARERGVTRACYTSGEQSGSYQAVLLPIAQQKLTVTSVVSLPVTNVTTLSTVKR